MKISLRISFVCFILIVLLEAFMGFRYIFASSPMPYHLVAMGDGWNAASSEVQFLLVMLIKATGIGIITTLVSMCFLLFIPFRKGEPWSRWALFSVSFLHSSLLIWITLLVKEYTNANPPTYIGIAGVTLSVIGLLLSKDMKTFRG